MRTLLQILMTGGLHLLFLVFRRRERRADLVLVTLTDAQIERAKAADGERKKITHAVVCGCFGRMFGTERQCLKQFGAWAGIFVPGLLERAVRTDSHEFRDFRTTPNLRNVLFRAEP